MDNNLNGVMMQYFHWHLTKELEANPSTTLWQFLEKQAPKLREIGISAVWIPPACICKSENDVGYGVYDFYNLGEWGSTKYGTKAQLHRAINALHGCNEEGKRIDGLPYISVYADIVMNHKDGDPEDSTWQAVRVSKDNRNEPRWGNGYEEGIVEVKGYTKFIPDVNKSGKYSSFEWHARHFDGINWAKNINEDNKWELNDNGSSKYIYRFIFNENNYNPQSKSWDHWVSNEKGNYDYLCFADLDFGRDGVRTEMKNWGVWLLDTMGFDGFRIDAAKHISYSYQREWIGHVRNFTGKQNAFCVGEFLSYDHQVPQAVHDYIDEVSMKGFAPQELSVFDFALHMKFANVSNGHGNLRALDSGTLMHQRPTNAVTFVENHDTQILKNHGCPVSPWFKPLAYSFILLRPNGYPCVFFDDFYGDSVPSKESYEHFSGEEYLSFLLKLRKQFALGEERYYDTDSVAGWVRMGFTENAKGAMAVVMNIDSSVKAIKMNTGRFNKRFYHLATIKHTPSGYNLTKYHYNMYGDKADGLYTDQHGEADFVCDKKSVSIWIEDGAGLD